MGFGLDSCLLVGGAPLLGSEAVDVVVSLRIPPGVQDGSVLVDGETQRWIRSLPCAKRTIAMRGSERSSIGITWLQVKTDLHSVQGPEDEWGNLHGFIFGCCRYTILPSQVLATC